MTKIKEYLIISGVSLIVSLYLFEGYLSFKEQLSKEQLSKEQLYEKQTGKKWDRRSKLDIYKELKKNNNKITVAYHPSYILKRNYSIFPLSGVSNSETIDCNENGYYSIYQSDRYGFSNPDNEWDKKEIEYLLVGDSFTHGACVNRPNDISSILRSLSNKTVLNLGYTGNGPLIEYATLREYLDKNVKKVLWVYFEGNDLTNLKDEKTNNIIIKYLEDLNFTQNLKFKQNEINEFLKKKLIEIEINVHNERINYNKKNEKIEYKILKFIRLNKTKQIIRNSLLNNFEENNSEVNDNIKTILFLSRDLVIKNNSKMYFVYLPTYNRYKTSYDNTNYNLVKEIVNELNIPFIDIHKEVFEKEQNPLKLFPFELVGHYNVDGYKKVAETIYKFTSE
jgi:lysophospholipase L1-like esterase